MTKVPRALLLLVVLLAIGWGAMAVWLTPWASASVRGLALAAYALVVVLSGVSRGTLARRAGILGAAAGAGLLVRALPAPEANRAWVPGHARQATVRVDGERLLVHDLRDFRYSPSGTPVPAWRDRVYDLAALDTAWLAVSPFSSIPGVGHVFVSFGFGPDDFLAVSVEARREEGEAYSPLPGMFRRYETIYVVGTEEDLMALRARVWRDALYLYPVKATPDRTRAMLLSMLERATALQARPAWYDTLLASCSSTVARHVNEVAPGRVPFGARVLLAGWSDELALEHGLLDVEGSLDEVRARFRVPDVDPVLPGYSRSIRARLSSS